VQLFEEMVLPTATAAPEEAPPAAPAAAAAAAARKEPLTTWIGAKMTAELCKRTGLGLDSLAGSLSATLDGWLGAMEGTEVITSVRQHSRCLQCVVLQQFPPTTGSDTVLYVVLQLLLNKPSTEEMACSTQWQTL
jgi:hypothetical protein